MADKIKLEADGVKVMFRNGKVVVTPIVVDKPVDPPEEKPPVEKPPVDDSEKQSVKEWSERPEIIRREVLEEGTEDVRMLQWLLNRFLDDDLSHPLTEDGKPGKLSEDAWELYQAYRMLEPGAVGPLTRGDMYKAYCEGWTDHEPYMLDGKVLVYGMDLAPMGDIPRTYGEISHFGGRSDCDDLMYGQAYLSKSDNPSPKVFCEYNKELVDMGILRAECLELDEYPYVECGSRQVKASGSWCLDRENGYYCAVYTSGAFGLYGADNPKVVIKNSKNGKIAVLLRTDKGPRPDCGAIDVGPRVMEDLDLDHDDNVIIGWADHDAEIGVYE